MDSSPVKTSNSPVCEASSNNRLLGPITYVLLCDSCFYDKQHFWTIQQKTETQRRAKVDENEWSDSSTIGTNHKQIETNKKN